MRVRGPLVVFAIALGIGCGDGGTGTDEEGEGEEGGVVGCDVYDGPDEFMSCVCADVKPACHGFTSSDCEQSLRGPLKQAQFDGGLECVQALGDLYTCEFELTCAEFGMLLDYWSTCNGRQPYCRHESAVARESCSIFSPPCGP